MTLSFDTNTRSELREYFLARARQYEALANRVEKVDAATKPKRTIQGAERAGNPIPVITQEKAPVKRKPGKKKTSKKKSALDQSTATLQ